MKKDAGKVKLTVFFENPYWKGLFEKFYEGKYEVKKVIFGEEPKDYDIYDFILKNYAKISFSTPVNSEDREKAKRINPKRLKRKIKKELQYKGIATKAQQAIKKEFEANKIQRKNESKKIKEEEKRRKFALKQQKKKIKHRGH